MVMKRKVLYKGNKKCPNCGEYKLRVTKYNSYYEVGCRHCGRIERHSK